MSGKLLRLLSESSLIRFRFLVDDMIQYIAALRFAGGGGSGRLESAGWKGRLISKESRQRSYGSREIYVSVVSIVVIFVVFIALSPGQDLRCGLMGHSGRQDFQQSDHLACVVRSGYD